MALDHWLRRRLPFLLCSSILLGIQCPPIVVDSFKYGVTNWVTGSFSAVSFTQFSDFILNVFTGGPTFGFQPV